MLMEKIMTTTTLTIKKRRFPKHGTIGFIVLTTMKENPNVTSDELEKVLRPMFQETKWNKAHLAWYKHQVKNGAYDLNDAPETNKKKKTIKKVRTKKTNKKKEE